jgi:cell division septation protein DedD
MYYVQVGAFASKENAEKFLAEVQRDYPDAFIKIM